MFTKKLKAGVLFSAFTLLVVFLISFINPETTPISPAPNVEDEFLLGAMNTGYDFNFKYVSDTLGFNLWHRYTGTTRWGGRSYPTGWQYFANSAPGDTLFA